jgi:hypothetical protein
MFKTTQSHPWDNTKLSWKEMQGCLERVLQGNIKWHPKIILYCLQETTLSSPKDKPYLSQPYNLIRWGRESNPNSPWLLSYVTMVPHHGGPSMGFALGKVNSPKGACYLPPTYGGEHPYWCSWTFCFTPSPCLPCCNQKPFGI